MPTRTTTPQVQPDMRRIAEIALKLRRLSEELKAIFPEREQLVQQIVYALLTREHVLVYGPYGTGKSDLVSTLFRSFDDAELFSIALSKFMTESSVVGAVDPKLLREEGEVRHKTEGTIVTCHFAELDELFDANSPLLRVLLGILNERHFKRGRQSESARLHTAVASTNGHPIKEMAKDEALGAVVDRFLFHAQVGYLAEEESRRRMYKKYVEGAKPTSRMTYEEIAEISSVVVGANQITDDYFLEIYDRVIQAYRQARPDEKISDRRACKLLKLCEANALLFGRYEVVFEDILAIRWGLCTAGDQAAHDTFEQVALPIIEEANQSRKQHVDEVQLRLLDQYEARIPTLPSAPSDRELVALKRKLIKLRNEIDEIIPQLQSTQDRKDRVLRQVDQLVAEVQAQIDRES